jgi:hypothetical protein
MNIKLAKERLQNAQDLLLAIQERRAIKNCLFGIFEGDKEYLTKEQILESLEIALSDTIKAIHCRPTSTINYL